MNTKYSEEELAKAIEDLIEALGQGNALDALIKKHPVIEEINMFSWRGPCGVGLGRFGGHAV